MTWLDAEPGPAALVVAALLLAYFVAVEPRWGRTVFARLARQRSSDPGALLAFDRLTIGVQVGAAVAVAVAVLLDPGVGAASIGWRLPSAPADELLPVIVGGAIGLVLAAAAGIVVGARTARRGKGLPVAPASIAPMIPVTRTERWWAAGVAVGAGVSEELVFRGLLLAVGVGLGLPPVLVAAVLTVVFGAAHYYQGISGMLATTVLGALMSALALATGSLLVPIVLHVAIDLRGLLLTRPAEEPAWRRPGPAGSTEQRPG